MVVCIDELGPMTAVAHPGPQLVHPHPGEGRPAQRARQELEYQPRTTQGYVFGALQPATGATLAVTYERRNIANFVDFLEQVEAWIPGDVPQVYAVLDNLRTHAAYDVLLFNLSRPRWAFVFQPKRAPYLNLIEPWWKTLKSLALKGRRFETWPEVETAIQRATAYWNDHKHPYVWGRRRRHRLPKRFGVAATPEIAIL